MTGGGVLKNRPRRLARCNNIADLRVLAQRRLPAPMFHYIDGGADDEWSLGNNTAAFDDYELIPDYLVDISSVDTSTTLLGRRIDVPFFVAPTGMSRLFHHESEPAVARATARFGTFYTLSTVGTTSLEDIARCTQGPKMFQIYILKDRGLTREFVARCRDAGYDALCLTVDTAIAGNRERDRITGMVLPPRFGPASLLSFAAHPGWSLRLLTHRGFALANVVHRVDALAGKSMSLIEYVNSQFDRTVTWKDVEWLIDEWGKPFVIKGIQSVSDAQRAVAAGAQAIMISNHGGRQLDATPAPVDCVVPIRDAIGDALELIVDGGVRRGTHIAKALALGANACSVGRAYLYGLAAGGQRGVERALDMLRSEFERSLALLGCRNPAQLGPGHVHDRRFESGRRKRRSSTELP